MATLGNDNIEVILPDGVSEDAVDVTTGEDGNNVVVVSQNVEGLEITATGDNTGITGKKVETSTVSATPKKGESSNVVVETTVFKGNTIANEGKGSLEVNVNTGKFKKSVIDAGDKKRDDLVRFKDNVLVNRATMDLGKGDDTVRFGKGVTFKGKTTIDLGKGGADSVIVEANAVEGGKLSITNFTRKDTITVGDETFTYKDIKNGAEIPNVKIELV